MSHHKDVISGPFLSKRLSESKLQKTMRRASRLPKCSPIKLNCERPKTADTDANQPALDFPTRMKLKEKISELQQLNNELRFKLTTAETKLRAKDSELITAESLNKQIKHLLDKHINREQEQNSQIINLEKRISKASQQIGQFEEEKRQFSDEKNVFQNLTRLTQELTENLSVKEAQIFDLSEQLAEIKQSFSITSFENKTLNSQLEEAKNIVPMLNVRKNYINLLEDKLQHWETQCSSLSVDNCKLKCGIDRLEIFRFHSFLAAIAREINPLQC